MAHQYQYRIKDLIEAIDNNFPDIVFVRPVWFFELRSQKLEEHGQPIHSIDFGVAGGFVFT